VAVGRQKDKGCSDVNGKVVRRKGQKGMAGGGEGAAGLKKEGSEEEPESRKVQLEHERKRSIGGKSNQKREFRGKLTRGGNYKKSPK